MSFFSRFRSKGAQPASKSKTPAPQSNGGPVVPSAPKWQSQWTSREIVPEEVMELVHTCTTEMKSRAEALDAPFLLLPFRPNTNSQGARTFIRNFFKHNAEGSSQYRGAALQQELRLTEAVVLCSILKWCWSRMPNGVVTWPVYEGFQMGERESNMARNAFHTFIPISADSEARSSIIFDFFDLLAAVAAHGKMNGLGGRKLSRMAGWFAFEHIEDGNGFEGGYKSWRTAADASSHMFFAYLRSLSPDTDPSLNVIERIPRSLQALLASTEYPPDVPAFLKRATPRVVMLVDIVSPTPFTLLRRAKHFEFRDNDHVLREFQEFEDPIDALTDECKRVLYAISSTNSTAAKSRQSGLPKKDESWSAFSNQGFSVGFSDADEKAASQNAPTDVNRTDKTTGQGLRSEAQSRNNEGNRPTTPSWADFLSSGFIDDDTAKSPALLYPPAHVLPPLGNQPRAQSAMNFGEIEELSPGELAAITSVDLDDAFWWVWMTSLAGEESANRKGVFGRCALIETNIMDGRWLIIEEQVKGASPEPVEATYIAPKKGIFSFTKRGRLGRKTPAKKMPPTPETQMQVLSPTPSKTSIGPDQHARIKAAAAALARKRDTPDSDATSRRGRSEAGHTKTNSMLTLGLQSEAGPAMQWTSAYDKSTIRKTYLGDSLAGRGKSREDLAKQYAATASTQDANQPALPALSANIADRELPAPPVEQSIVEPYHHAEQVEPTSNAQMHAAQIAPTSVPEPTAVPEATYASPEFAETSQTSAMPEPELEPERMTAANAFEKELAVDEPSSPASARIERRPVNRNDNLQDHPAFRDRTPTDLEPKPAPPASNPAALAAQRAMQSSNKQASPESQKSGKNMKKQSSAGGLKKFFGKKKEVPGRDSYETTRPASNNGTSLPESGLSRRISLMRKKPTSPTPQNDRAGFAPSPPPKSSVSPEAIAASQAAVGLSAPNRSNVDLSEHEHAAREFSRFDQGPLDDMPANLMPVPSPQFSASEPSPEPEPHHEYNTLAAQRLAPRAMPGGFDPDEFVTPMEREDPINDNASETTMEDHHDPAVVQDRWTNIRENAAKRAAAAARASEEQSRPSQSQRTEDGDTSGEETIESRVARIKARVAELTGNIDTHR